jgi:hypothetical protein
LCKKCVYTYVNVKIIPIETIPRMGRGGQRRAMEGVNSSMIYLKHFKNFRKCHNVSPPSTTIKEQKIYINNQKKYTEQKIPNSISELIIPFRIG